MHVLVVTDPLSKLDALVPVLHGLDQIDQVGFDTCFFTDLAHGGDFRRLAWIYDALGQLPAQTRLYRNDR